MVIGVFVRAFQAVEKIVPTLCVGMPHRTLRVRLLMGRGASRAAFLCCAWERSKAQATCVFNARRNALSNFTMSCGSSRCGTFTSMLFFLVVDGPESLAKSCGSLEVFPEKKIRPTAQGKIAVLFLPGKPAE